MYVRDVEGVRNSLRSRVLAGYLPSRTMESCEDHATDFFAISAEEFAAIVRDALRERGRRRPARH